MRWQLSNNPGLFRKRDKITETFCCPWPLISWPQLELFGLEGCEQWSQCLLSLFLRRRAQCLECHISYFKGKCTAWKWSFRSQASYTVLTDSNQDGLHGPWSGRLCIRLPWGAQTYGQDSGGGLWWVGESIPNRATLEGTVLQVIRNLLQWDIYVFLTNQEEKKRNSIHLLRTQTISSLSPHGAFSILSPSRMKGSFIFLDKV